MERRNTEWVGSALGGSLDAKLHVSVSYGKGDSKGDMLGGVFKYSWVSELAF